MMLKADFNPAAIARKEGSESIVVSLFTPKDSTAQGFLGRVGGKLYDLAVGVRRYTKQDGTEKTSWENVGLIIQGEKTPYMMLKAHFNPAGISRKEGSESIVISMFPPKPKESSPEEGYVEDFEPQSFDPDAPIPF